MKINSCQCKCNNLSKICLNLVMLLNEILSIILLIMIVILDEKEKLFTYYFDLVTSLLLILFIPIQAFQFLNRLKYKRIVRQILLLLAIIILLFSAISQISQAFLDNNGNGKVPLFDPHNKEWYRLRTISRVIQYCLACVIILQQIYLYLKRDSKIYFMDTNLNNDVMRSPLTSDVIDVQENENNVKVSSTPPDIDNTFEKSNNALNILKQQHQSNNSSN